MARDNKDNGSTTVRLFGRLAAEKRKSVTALCMVAIMAFMWIRVLARKAPEAAAAAFLTDQAGVSDESGSAPKVSFIELPKVAGRNDEITRDFFTADGWKRFERDTGGGNPNGVDVNSVTTDGSERVVKSVTAKLKLQAIELGRSPRAYINDKLLSVGDRLCVRDGENTYECEVIRIGVNEVSVKTEETEIVLKLAQAAKEAD